MSRIKTCLFVVTAILAGAPQALALTVLQGSEAANYIGDIKQHLLSGHYTCDILARSHRDAMHGRFSDGVVLNADGGLFKFLKRKDGDCDVILDAPGGREEEPVNEDFWLHKLANALGDDNNIPYVFLDDGKKELGIVFVGDGSKVDGKMRDGNLEILVNVPGAKDNRSRRRMMI